jgi:hypothetical protein
MSIRKVVLEIRRLGKDSIEPNAHIFQFVAGPSIPGARCPTVAKTYYGPYLPEERAAPDVVLVQLNPVKGMAAVGSLATRSAKVWK